MTNITKIEKIFTEIESLIAALWQEAANHTNDWKNKPDNEIKVAIEKRLNHLFDNLQPSLNDEKKLDYDFGKLKEILMKIIDRLPNLIDEKGEINEKLLALLTNASEASEKLKSEMEAEEEWIEPTNGDFYEFLKKIGNDETDSESDSEEEWLRNELTKEKMKNAELRKRLTALEVAEKDRDNQLKQAKEREKQMKNEVKIELETIALAANFPGELADKELTNFLTRLREMKSWLINGTDEQKRVIEGEHEWLKKVLGQLKLEEQRRSTKQRISDALTDKEEMILKKRIEIEEHELPKERHRNYAWILEEMNNPVEIVKFEKEMLNVITKQRGEYHAINEALISAKKAIESKNVKKAKKMREYLLTFRKLQLMQKEVSDDYDIFLNKLGSFHGLIFELNSFVDEQEKLMSQIIQPAK